MFERFTTDAREVVVRARAEARALKHPTIGTEHLLLGLLGDPGPAGTVLRGVLPETGTVRADIDRRVGPSEPIIDEQDAAALRSVGIDPDAVLAKIEESFGPEAVLQPRSVRKGWFGRRTSSARFAPRAKKVLELSLREALRLKHREISTGHLLLGLIREGEGLGALILVEAGADLAGLRTQVEAGLRRAA